MANKRERDLETSSKVAPQPIMYRVWLHTGSSATLRDLVDIIQDGFSYDTNKSHDIAIELIDNGKVLCCVLPRDVAETKVEEINTIGSAHGDAVTCVLQKGCAYVVRKN